MIQGNPMTPMVAEASFYSSSAVKDTANMSPKELGSMFEAILYRTLFSQMRSASIGEDPFMSGSGSKQLQTMLDDEMAEEMGRKGALGFADMISEEVNRRQGLVK